MLLYISALFAISAMFADFNFARLPRTHWDFYCIALFILLSQLFKYCFKFHKCPLSLV